jgi:hypothetical protein
MRRSRASASVSKPDEAESQPPRLVPSSGHPVVFRLPKGYILILGSLFVGMILLSYWVGDARGYKRGSKAISDDHRFLSQVQPVDIDPGSSSATRTNGPIIQHRSRLIDRPLRQAVVTTIRQQPTDPRSPQMHYFVLAHCDETYAKRVVAYLLQEGLESAAVKRHNTAPFQVFVLRGFTRDEITAKTPVYRQYEKRLRELGRLWKAGNKSAKDWDDMYLSLYKGGGSTEAVVTTR